MIDFENADFLKLRRDESLYKTIEPLLIPGEEVIGCYRTVRDGVAFTDRRIITVNIQGVGKKRDFTTLPYSRIQAYSIETSGVMDIDSELSLYFSTLGQVRFEFFGSSDILKIQRIIADHLF